MAKLKKKRPSKRKKTAVKPTESQVRRNQVLFALGVVGAMLLVVGLGYGYTFLSTDLQTRKGLKRIASDDEATRLKGIANLAKARAREHMPALGRLLLSDPSTKVRRSATRALERMKDRRAIPWLMFGLGDEADSVAEAAMASLRKYLGEEFGWEDALTWWYEHRGEFDTAPDGVPVVDAMAKLLEREEYYIRLAAVHRLARLRHEAARPLLELAAEDDHKKVRDAAKEALAEK